MTQTDPRPASFENPPAGTRLDPVANFSSRLRSFGSKRATRRQSHLICGESPSYPPRYVAWRLRWSTSTSASPPSTHANSAGEKTLRNSCGIISRRPRRANRTAPHAATRFTRRATRNAQYSSRFALVTARAAPPGHSSRSTVFFPTRDEGGGFDDAVLSSRAASGSKTSSSSSAVNVSPSASTSDSIPRTMSRLLASCGSISSRSSASASRDSPSTPSPRSPLRNAFASDTGNGPALCITTYPKSRPNTTYCSSTSHGSVSGSGGGAYASLPSDVGARSGASALGNHLSGPPSPPAALGPSSPPGASSSDSPSPARAAAPVTSAARRSMSSRSTPWPMPIACAPANLKWYMRGCLASLAGPASTHHLRKSLHGARCDATRLFPYRSSSTHAPRWYA